MTELTTTIHIRECYPEHPAREDDPHYHIFNQTKRRLASLGKLTCWINNKDCQGDIELHHDKVEFALQNGVDLTKFSEVFPEFTGKTDEEFLAWIESEGNLLPLCRQHHIGVFGIHVIPYPLWLPQKFLKDGVVAPGMVIHEN